MNDPYRRRSPARREALANCATNNPSDTPNIADRFADLLAQLSPRRRRGFIARLSQGYYEGWRPSRAEVEELITRERSRRDPKPD